MGMMASIYSELNHQDGSYVQKYLVYVAFT